MQPSTAADVVPSGTSNAKSISLDGYFETLLYLFLPNEPERIDPRSISSHATEPSIP